MKKKFLFHLILIIAALIFCLAVLEIGVRIMYPRFANYNLEMWRYIAKMKQPCNNPRLPFVHYPNREGLFYGVKIKTNSMGFRGAEIKTTKEAHTCRIVVLGDSLIMGWGVPLENTVPYLLEQKLNSGGKRLEVVNLGVGNYNTTMEVELFKERGLPLDPDMVILVFFVNDPEPVPRNHPLLYPIKRYSYLSAVFFDLYQRVRTRFDTHFNWYDYYSNLYLPQSPALAENKQALQDLIQLCKERNLPLLIVSYPELHQLKDYPLTMATTYIQGMAENSGTPFLDLLPYFSEHEPESLWVSTEDAHGNEVASEIAAQAIYHKVAGFPCDVDSGGETTVQN